MYANRAALKLFECSEPELLTRNFSDIDAACKNGGWPIFVDALRTAGAVERDVAMRGTSAHSILLGLNSSIIQVGVEELIVCFALTNGDGPGTAKAINSQLALITDSLAIMIAHVDRDLHYTFVNKSYERLFGRDRSDLVGLKLEDVLGANDMANVAPYIQRVLLGETVTFERALYKTSLGKRIVRKTFSRGAAENGQIVGYFVLGQDVTEEADIRDARELSEARAEKAKG